MHLQGDEEGLMCYSIIHVIDFFVLALFGLCICRGDQGEQEEQCAENAHVFWRPKDSA
jgi:hypothetical protein